MNKKCNRSRFGITTNGILIVMVSMQLFGMRMAHAQLSKMCDALFVDNDSIPKIVISEIVPMGQNPFIELWNCDTKDFTAHLWYIDGLYSGIRDSIRDTTISAQSLLVLPLAQGLFMHDGLQLSVKKYNTDHDSLITIVYAVTYALTDSAMSISFCEWFRQTNPTPNSTNVCDSAQVTNTTDPEQYSNRLLFTKRYTLMGQELTDKSPRGLYVLVRYYENGKIDTRLIKQ